MDHNRVAKCESKTVRVLHDADRIDSANTGKAPDDLSAAGGCQCILVVHAGKVEADSDLTFVEVVQRQFRKARSHRYGIALDEV